MTDQTLNLLALAGVLLWTAALVADTFIRNDDDGPGWHTNTISHYLTGTASAYVDAGFCLLAIGLAALSMTVGVWAGLFYVIAAVGTLGAGLTRFAWRDDVWHIRCAGMAFGGIGVGDLIASWGHTGMLMLALLAPLVALLTLRTRQNSAIQEKSVAFFYVIWVVLATSSRLVGHGVI